MATTHRTLLMLILMCAPLSACSSLFEPAPADAIGTNTVPTEWVFLGLPNVQLVTDASATGLEATVSGNPMYVAADIVDSAFIDGWTKQADSDNVGVHTVSFTKDGEVLTVTVDANGARPIVRATRENP
ncbi:MAG: hypothetical protein ACJAZO_001955 [Myxococcota bacterium]|jgi:hypothetical protein